MNMIGYMGRWKMYRAHSVRLDFGKIGSASQLIDNVAVWELTRLYGVIMTGASGIPNGHNIAKE